MNLLIRDNTRMFIYLTLKSEGFIPVTQCAAVTSHCGATNVPPQYCSSELVYIALNCACHGQAPWGASVPPTIRTLGL